MSDPTIDHDLIYPRDDENRFRLYALDSGSLNVLATVPSLEAVGTAIAQFREDLREIGATLADLGATGVLDAVEREWIINPFPRRL